MRHYLLTVPAVLLLPALSACSLGPQGTGFGYQGEHHQPAASNYETPNYQHNMGQAYSGAIRSQGDLWCSAAGCAPKSTYPVSDKPTAHYGTQPSAHAYGTQTGHYAKTPKLRGAYKKANQSYFYGNLGAVAYDTSSDLYGVQGRFGYQSKSLWGAEAEGSIGVDDDQVNDLATASSRTDNVDYSVAAFALARLPLTQRISAHARAGYHLTEVSSEFDDGVNPIIELSDDFDGFAYGAGAEFALTPKDAIRLDYTRYEGDSRDLDAISLGYARKF